MKGICRDEIKILSNLTVRCDIFQSIYKLLKNSRKYSYFFDIMGDFYVYQNIKCHYLLKFMNFRNLTMLYGKQVWLHFRNFCSKNISNDLDS